MKILVSGSSGFIGSHLVPYLKNKGHNVFKLLRGKDIGHGTDSVTWDPENGKYNPLDFDGFDAVVNLAGENIASFWTEAKKRKIEESRVKTTLLLSTCLAELTKPPKVLVNASAIGIYGNQGDTVVTEKSTSGSGFLAHVCREWEAATDPAQLKGIRVVRLRFGVVLSSDGGILGKMLLPFKLGLGGILGSGKQYMSWITIEDLLNLILYAIENDALQGAVNAVSPDPVTNEEFTKSLGNILKRPTAIRTPAFLLRALFREMAEEMLLSSTRAIPQRLLENGFSFQYPDLESALKKELAKD